MAVTTTTPAGRTVAANALANRQRIAREEAAARRADVTTPLHDARTPQTDAPAPATLGKAPLADVPEPPKAEKPAPAIVLSLTTIYRGRQITITGENMTLDQFCDLLDRRLGVAQ